MDSRHCKGGAGYAPTTHLRVHVQHAHDVWVTQALQACVLAMHVRGHAGLRLPQKNVLQRDRIAREHVVCKKHLHGCVEYTSVVRIAMCAQVRRCLSGCLAELVTWSMCTPAVAAWQCKSYEARTHLAKRATPQAFALPIPCSVTALSRSVCGGLAALGHASSRKMVVLRAHHLGILHGGGKVQPAARYHRSPRRCVILGACARYQRLLVGQQVILAALRDQRPAGSSPAQRARLGMSTACCVIMASELLQSQGR